MSLCIYTTVCGVWCVQCLLASSLPLSCLCWCVATFLTTLPPPTVDQWYSMKPSAGWYITPPVCTMHTCAFWCRCTRYKQNMTPSLKNIAPIGQELHRVPLIEEHDGCPCTSQLKSNLTWHYVPPYTQFQAGVHLTMEKHWYLISSMGS